MSLRRRRDIWDVVVVGGGIGGLTAAWYAARRGLPTAVIEADVMLGWLLVDQRELAEAERRFRSALGAKNPAIQARARAGLDAIVRRRANP